MKINIAAILIIILTWTILALLTLGTYSAALHISEYLGLPHTASIWLGIAAAALAIGTLEEIARRRVSEQGVNNENL